MKKVGAKYFERRDRFERLNKYNWKIVDENGEIYPGKNNEFLTKTCAENCIRSMIKKGEDITLIQINEKNEIKTDSCTHPREKRIYLGGFGHYKCGKCGKDLK